LEPVVPKRYLSASDEPFTTTESAPAPRSTLISISEIPTPSGVRPGSNRPFDRSIVSVWPAPVPFTLTVSMLFTVAPPQSGVGLPSPVTLKFEPDRPIVTAAVTFTVRTLPARLQTSAGGPQEGNLKEPMRVCQ